MLENFPGKSQENETSAEKWQKTLQEEEPRELTVLLVLTEMMRITRSFDASIYPSVISNFSESNSLT